MGSEEEGEREGELGWERAILLFRGKCESVVQRKERGSGREESEKRVGVEG